MKQRVQAGEYILDTFVLLSEVLDDIVTSEASDQRSDEPSNKRSRPDVSDLGSIKMPRGTREDT
jgi:hypothetical protein